MVMIRVVTSTKDHAVSRQLIYQQYICDKDEIPSFRLRHIHIKNSSRHSNIKTFSYEMRVKIWW